MFQTTNQLDYLDSKWKQPIEPSHPPIHGLTRNKASMAKGRYSAPSEPSNPSAAAFPNP